MKVILVPGTHSWRGEASQDWFSPTSAFVGYLGGVGFTLLDTVHPYTWDTGLGGVGFGDDDLIGWQAAGINLLHYVVPPRCKPMQVPGGLTILITHSHGLQPVLFAAAAGLKVDLCIDVAGPVRQDMMPTAERARQNIRRWVHVHAGKRDWWQVWGALFDGRWGIVREHRLADLNIPVPAADHGDVLRNPAYFPVIGRALLQECREAP
ncbi:MAG: hypothetical protein ACRD26_23560 [Vicinamibacterales bacterium]